MAKRTGSARPKTGDHDDDSIRDLPTPTCPSWCETDHGTTGDRAFHHDGARTSARSLAGDTLDVMASQYVNADGGLEPATVTVIVNGVGPYELSAEVAHAFGAGIIRAAEAVGP